MIYLTNIDLNRNELQNAVIQPLAAAPSNPRLGQIYTNSADKKIMYYDGTAWKNIGVVVSDSATNGKIVVDGVEMTVYELPAATNSALGGIKVGAGLTIDGNGVLSATGGGTADAVEWENVLNRPTNLSAFNNDEGFIDNTVSNLANYYTKSQTYTKDEVTGLIGQISTLSIEVVQTLPTENISTTTIYLKPKDGSQAQNVYDEYLYINSAWEKIGDTAIDLSGYLQKNGDASQVTATFSAAAAIENIVSGETLSIILGKVAKYLSELKTVATTGSYNDLTNKPNEVKMKRFTFAQGTLTKTYFTAGFAPVSVTVTEADDTANANAVLTDVVTKAATGGYHTAVTITSAYAKDLNVTICSFNQEAQEVV